MNTLTKHISVGLVLFTFFWMQSTAYGFSSGVVNYDNGQQPSIAVSDDNTVIEVHRASTEDTLWYHVGTATGTGVEFGKSYY